MKKFTVLFFLFLFGDAFTFSNAYAHTVSVGYEAAGVGAVDFWYGTYHVNPGYTEGSFRLFGNGLDITSPFSQLVTSKPAGLIDGTTNFYTNGTLLVGTNPNSAPRTWQGALISGLTAGTYVFTYIPIASPTSVWRPWDSIILSSSVTLTADIVGASDINSSHSSFPLSHLGGSVNPAFAGGTLQVDAPASVSQDFTISSAGGTIDQFGNTATFSGVLSDASSGVPGALTIANSGAVSGAVILTGVNTFTGATTVDSGSTLALSGAGSIASSSGVTDNGTFDISGTTAGASITTLTGNGTVALGANNLTLTNASGSFGGAIEGAGGLIVAGGTTTLTGNNGYTGSTAISSGAIVALLGTGSVAASSGVANNGTFDISGTTAGASVTTLTGNGTIALGANNLTLTNASGSFNGTIEGAGGLIVAGGTATLTGNNGYTGGTAINSGAIVALLGTGSVAASSGVANNGTFDISGTTAGASITTLTGNGAVALGANNLTLTNASGSFDGTIEGAGGLIVAGGTTTLTGNNGYTGGTTANGGTLKVAADNNLGAASGALTLNAGTLENTASFTTTRTVMVTGNSAVDTDAGTTLTLAGAVQGSGSSCFIKSGSGALNMTGNANLPQGTCVQNGLLNANAVLNSAVTVDNIGTLRGSGTINGPITVHGTLAPGNSPGTLISNGTVTMSPGSTFQVDINGTGTGSGPGNYSRLVVVGAGHQFVAGNATLAPNLVNITGTSTYIPYVPVIGDRYRIITAEGGIVGQFAPLTQPAGMATGTRLVAFYDLFGSNSIDLRVLSSSYTPFAQTTGNANAQAAGGVLDAGVAAFNTNTATTAQNELLYQVANFSAAQLPAVTKSLAGEIHGAMAATAPRSGQFLQSIVSRQLNTSTANEAAVIEPNDFLWIDASINHSHTNGDDDASSFNHERTQLVVGADLLRTQTSRLGIGVSYATTQVSTSGGSGAIRETSGFVYGQHTLDTVIVDGIAAYGTSQWHTGRDDPLQAGDLKTDEGGNNRMVGIGVRRPLHLQTATIEPFVRALWQGVARGATNENTDSSAALALDKYSATGTRLMAGIAGGSDKRDPFAAAFTYQYSVALGSDTGNLQRPAVHTTLANSTMTIVAPQDDRGFLQANLTGTALLGHGAYGYAAINSEVRNGRTDVGANLGLKISF